jgi:V8-like Glu-specific endopeptidase
MTATSRDLLRHAFGVVPPAPRSYRRVAGRALLAMAATIAVPALHAQSHDRSICGASAPYDHRFSPTDNSTGTSRTIGEHLVAVPGSSFLTLRLQEALLPNGGRIEIFVPASDETVHLDAARIRQTGGHSPLLRGDTARVRVIAGPHTTGTTARITEVGSSSTTVGPATICGSSDDRVLSSDVRVGRMIMSWNNLFYVGTGFLISDTNCFVTAGHNLRFGPTGEPPNWVRVEFSVPSSTASGALVPAALVDQYPWDPAWASGLDGSCGNDYGVFRTLVNGITGLHAGTSQGDYLRVTTLPATSALIRITGYGADSTPLTDNHVQQTHVGTLEQSTGYCIGYRVDTMGGNSGSPVIDTANDRVFGIHTLGGCDASAASTNRGTWMENPDFVAMCEATCQGQNMPAHFVPYGVGCAGRSGTIPLLRDRTRPVIGSTFTQTLSQATPMTLGVFVVGYASYVPPFDLGFLGRPGCSIGASLDILLVLPIDAAGSSALSVAIPASGELIGGRVYTQVIVIDPSAAIFVDAVSNSGRVSLGL